MTSDTQHDFDSLLDARPLGRFQYTLALLTALVVLVDGFDTQVISLVAPEIAHEWHLSTASFGLVFSAGLFGMVVGAAIFGTLGDRLGRKPTLLATLLVFGGLSLATPLVSSVGELTVLRFLTGLGLGGAVPLAISTVAEYLPTRVRSTALSLSFCGYPAGVVVAGAITTDLLNAFGWRGVFVISGLVPLLMVPVMWLCYPESARILVSRERWARLDRIVAGLRLPVGGSRELTFAASTRRRSAVRGLFAEGRAAGTLLLWVVLFLSLAMAYFLNSWMSIVARNSGFSLRSSILAIAALNLGGIIGSFVLGRLADRYRTSVVVGAAYLIGAACVAVIGQLQGSSALLLVVALIGGFFALGAQLCVVPLCANFYPAAVRATGIGWSTGIGRIGGILGPSVGGLLISAGSGPSTLFAVAGGVTAAAGLSVFVFGFFEPRPRRVAERAAELAAT